MELASALDTLRQTLRPGQRELADWQGGILAVSAVPGAGKSHGMAVAAALTLARQAGRNLSTGRKSAAQLVLVTFTRSAVASLKAKVQAHLRDLNLASGGFTVQTLHSLALNIASRHPQLSGIRPDQFTLISLNQQHRLLRTAIEQWIAYHPALFRLLLEQGNFDGEETELLRRQSVLRTDVLPQLTKLAIHEAKSSGLQPQDLWAIAEQVPDQLSVLTLAAGLYERYQELMRSHNLMDYDDMIVAALRVLQDPEARQHWQTQIYAVFEDEAQDSTPLQTQMLDILAQDPTDPTQCHLVRVGDPNQAINSTFTPADPVFFRRFCDQCQGQGRLALMNQAGRSSPPILEAANRLLTWANQQASTEQPFRPQTIAPAAAGDPQADANPPPIGAGVEIHIPPDIFATVAQIGQRVAELLTATPEARAAVLVRENKQGRFVAEVLGDPQRYDLAVDLPALGIEIFDVGSRDRRSHVPGELLTLLQFLARPHSPDGLKAALRVLANRQLIPSQDLSHWASQPEQFLYPGPLDPALPPGAQSTNQLCCKLLRARWELPHYQLISFLALALQYDASELATADKLASRLIQQTQGGSTMDTTLAILQEIVSSEQFEPVDAEESEAPYLRAGQLTIMTFHKAKGLDWDYVFLPFLHERTMPGQLWVPKPAQFLGDFTLAEVARAQIRAYVHDERHLPPLAEAWQRAEDLKVAEEWRLLYVAMTRARRLLWMSAAAQAPYRWYGFDWQRPDSLSRQAPSPAIAPLSDWLAKQLAHDP
uniref:ATP-dependent helicase n=1 Tax=Petrachloros mirabilis TaxID=2918835 RepID=UPI00308420BB